MTLAFVSGCGGGSAKSTCVPGASIACVGPAGCQGGQACKSDGTGYEACVCGGGTDGGVDSGGGSSGSAGASGGGGGASGHGGVGGGTAQPPIAGLSIWLEASKGVATADGGVSVWADQSGNGGDATASAGMVTPTTVNGRAALHFSNTNASRLAIPITTGITWGSGPFLLELVFRHSTAVNQRPVFWAQSDPTTISLQDLLFMGNTGKTAQSDLFARVTSSGSSFDLATAPNLNYNDNSLHSFGVRRDNSDGFQLLVDGTVAGTMTVSGVLIPAGFSAGIGQFEGDLLEIVGKNALVSDSDVAALETYFRAKYGTP